MVLSEQPQPKSQKLVTIPSGATIQTRLPPISKKCESKIGEINSHHILRIYSISSLNIGAQYPICFVLSIGNKSIID
jgi:hypothetical protein